MPALEMARDYALERYAFGRPIGSFQAIKHKLADVYVAIELARSNAYYGAWALSADAAELPLAAATARVSATEAFHLASKENIQTHGGIGFTWDVDCHLYLPAIEAARAGARVGALVEAPAGRTARNAQRGVGRRGWTSTTHRRKPRSAPRRARSWTPMRNARAGRGRCCGWAISAPMR